METEPAHSAEFLGGHRDYWWNQDYLELMALRLAFAKVSRVLDVGCGQGHWGRTVLRHMPESARLVGVDPEPRWAEKAAAAASERMISGGLSTSSDASNVCRLPKARLIW